MKKAVAQRSFEEIEKLNQKLAAEKARLHQEEESLLQKARAARK
jgi:peptidoglycan hydrolase CwlO-like protein